MCACDHSSRERKGGARGSLTSQPRLLADPFATAGPMEKHAAAGSLHSHLRGVHSQQVADATAVPGSTKAEISICSKEF